VVFVDLTAVSKTVPPSKQLLEFTLHISTDCDLRYITCKKELIIEILRRAHYVTFQRRLALYNIAKDSLKEYTTTESDFKKGISRFPPPAFRKLSSEWSSRATN
jgi:hypothetical protein